MSSAQLPDSSVSKGLDSVAPAGAPVDGGLNLGSGALPAGFLQPKDPGDVFHITDALAERLQTANYPEIVMGKIVMKRDPHPPQFNAKLADSIKALYNSLQIQIQPPAPMSVVD